MPFGQNQPTTNLLMQAMAYEAITVDNTVGGKALTAATYCPAAGRRASRAIITAEVAPMRYRYDGTAPLATEGHYFTPMQSLVVIGYEALKKIRFIRVGDNSGKIKITYER